MSFRTHNCCCCPTSNSERAKNDVGGAVETSLTIVRRCGNKVLSDIWAVVTLTAWCALGYNVPISMLIVRTCGTRNRSWTCLRTIVTSWTIVGCWRCRTFKTIIALSARACYCTKTICWAVVSGCARNRNWWSYGAVLSRYASIAHVCVK